MGTEEERVVSRACSGQVMLETPCWRIMVMRRAGSCSDRQHRLGLSQQGSQRLQLGLLLPIWGFSC